MKESYDLVETANRAGNFRVFLQALESAGLKQTLQHTGPYTVLAPVDDAFLNIPQTKLHDLFRMDNRAALRSMVMTHIIAGGLLSTELKTRDEIKSITGEELKVESRGGLWVNDGQIVTTDVKASNGVLHAIDAVLLPQPQVASAP